VILSLTNVLHVIHQELESQNVSAQMDSMITETFVLVVLITVIAVLIEILVLLVVVLESMLQLVTVQLVSMILVKLNVPCVELNVLLVTKTTSVPLVKTQPKELFQIVNVQLVGKMLLTVLIVLKNHIQMVLTI
jgi:hypothetical protein